MEESDSEGGGRGSDDTQARLNSAAGAKSESPEGGRRRSIKKG